VVLITGFSASGLVVVVVLGLGLGVGLALGLAPGFVVDEFAGFHIVVQMSFPKGSFWLQRAAYIH
jgi:ABC-type dipeptide/oligopeptide/nickel transport system permease subunit